MGPRIGLPCILVLLATLSADGGSRALAKALEPAECATLDAEVRTLESAGVMLDIEKGADWGKANLPAERIERIKHYFDLREKVLFRCPNIAAARQAEEAKAKGKKKSVKEDAAGGEEAAEGEGSSEFVIVVPQAKANK